jgi:hypothetical protein
MGLRTFTHQRPTASAEAYQPPAAPPRPAPPRPRAEETGFGAGLDLPPLDEEGRAVRPAEVAPPPPAEVAPVPAEPTEAPAPAAKGRSRRGGAKGAPARSGAGPARKSRAKPKAPETPPPEGGR